MKYEKANDVKAIIDDVIKTLKMDYIIKERIIAIRSYKSKSNAIARIYAFPKIWQTALDIRPFYVIEVLHEKYDKLSNKEKIKTIIHELLHIPKNFGGGLLGHKPHRNNKVEILYKEYIKIKTN